MKSADKCPSFTVISLSADGDVQAIEKVLKHYDAFPKPAYVHCMTNTGIFTQQLTQNSKAESEPLLWK